MCSFVLKLYANGLRVTEEAHKRFNAWADDHDANPIHPSLRASVWRAGIVKDTTRAVDIIKDEWRNTKSIDGKLFCLSVLGLVKDPEILKNKVIPFNFNTTPPSDAVPSADMHVLSGTLSSNIVGRPLQWEYAKQHWDDIVAKIGNPIVVDRLVNVSLSRFTEEAAIDDIESFFKDKDTSSFDRTLRTVADKIRGRAAYKKRDAASLKEWLSTNGYI